MYDEDPNGEVRVWTCAVSSVSIGHRVFPETEIKQGLSQFVNTKKRSVEFSGQYGKGLRQMTEALVSDFPGHFCRGDSKTKVRIERTNDRLIFILNPSSITEILKHA